MKIRFNELTLSRPPEQCYMELYEFRHVVATAVDKLGCRKWIFAKDHSDVGCTLFDVWNYVVSNRADLRSLLSQRDFIILTNFVLTFKPYLEQSKGMYLSDELGRPCSADIESDAADDGMLSVGFDFPRKRNVLQLLKSASGGGCIKEAVCVTRMEHFADDVVRRVIYCNSSSPRILEVEDKGFVSDDHGGKHFVRKFCPGRTLADWKREPWFEDTSDSLRAKFMPGITFNGQEFAAIERKALLEAMRAGRYSEGAIDGFEADLNETIGISRKALTHRVHICLSSRFLHLYPCD